MKQQHTHTAKTAHDGQTMKNDVSSSLFGMLVDDFGIFSSTLSEINSLIWLLIQHGNQDESPMYPLSQLQGIQYALERLSDDIEDSGKFWAERLKIQ